MLHREAAGTFELRTLDQTLLLAWFSIFACAACQSLANSSFHRKTETCIWLPGPCLTGPSNKMDVKSLACVIAAQL